MDFKQYHAEAMAKIKTLDEVLDAAEGGKGAGKRAIRNKIVNDNAAEFQPMVDNLVTNFGNLDVEKLVAVVGVVNKALATFDKQIDEYLNSLVPETGEAVSTISDEERARIGAERKKLFSQIKQLMELSESLEEGSTENWEVPQRRNVVSGPRGKQALSTYAYSVQTSNGDEIDLGDDDSLNDIAKKYGFAKSAELKAAFRTSATYQEADEEGNVGTKTGIDTSTPPRTFEFTFENGDVLIAVAPSASAD